MPARRRPGTELTNLEITGTLSVVDPTLQLQDEVKACTSAERESILASLQDSGVKVVVSTDQALAMKADLHITWTKLRIEGKT